MERSVNLHVAPAIGEARRLLMAECENVEHRDRIDAGSSTSRRRFVRDFAGKLGIDPSEIAGLDAEIVAKSDAADEAAEVEAAALPFVENDGGRRQSQATVLVKLALHGGVELWHSIDKEAYATVPVDEHREHHSVRSRAFKRWLAQLYYAATESAPGGQAIQDAIGVLEGKGVFDGPAHKTWIRIAEHEGSFYVDLANDDWQAVQINRGGWRVVNNPPVRFRRPKALGSLLSPKRGGDVALLRKYVNVTDEHWPLVVAFIVASLRSQGPYPVLCLHGEQGSGKSTQARAIRALIDPNDAPIRVEPRDSRDLMIAANNGWLVAYDNVSRLPIWLSDSLCRLSTGGGFSTRTLYENDEETIFNSIRPCILTGIEEVAVRGDLIDRSLLVTLPRLADERRIPETAFWQKFEADRPFILGAILDAAVAGLQRIESVQLERLPRMADFAVWAVACEPKLGLRVGEFLDAYEANRSGANEVALESCPVAKAVSEFVGRDSWLGEWSGTASNLLDELNRLAGHDDPKKRRPDGWPKSPRSLSGALRRVAPNLRRLEIDVSFDRSTGGNRTRIIMIRTGPELCVPIVPTVPESAEVLVSTGDRDVTHCECGTQQDAIGTQDDVYLERDGSLGTQRDEDFPTQSDVGTPTRRRVRL